MRFPARFVIIATGMTCAASPLMAQSATADAREAQSPQSSGTARAAGTQVDAAEEDMVCRKLRFTGTRVKKKVCRTKEEWAAIETAAKESANNIKDAGAVNTTASPGG